MTVLCRLGLHRYEEICIREWMTEHWCHVSIQRICTRCGHTKESRQP